VAMRGLLFGCVVISLSHSLLFARCGIDTEGKRVRR